MKLALLFILVALTTYAQDVRDVIRYNTIQFRGSSRFEAMGGAFGALGADFGAIAINPAGMGRYSSNNFGMNLAYTTKTTEGIFNNTATKSKFNKLNMNNLGIVISNDVSESNSGFTFVQLGFTYNKLADFNNNISYKGVQFRSLLDQFAENAYGLTPNEIYDYLPFSSALAYDAYAIDPDLNDLNGYIPRLGTTTMLHNRSITSKGGINEFNFNFSANYMNKLYLGASLALRTLRYESQEFHSEQVLDTSATIMDSFDYVYNLITRGSAASLKLGAIYLVNEQVRFGFSYHLPFMYDLKDIYSADMNSYQGATTYSIPKEWKPEGEYKYKLKHVGTVTASAAMVFISRGCINLDLDLVPYRFARLRSTDDSTYIPYNFKYENEEIKDALKANFNVRLGGEYVINSVFYLRAGLNYYGSPLKDNPEYLRRIGYTGGIGLKLGRANLDFTYTNQNNNFQYFAFSGSETLFKAREQAFMFNFNYVLR